ncbi:sphingosine 1-phosphate receptor 3 [Bufo bufo]|uniref:sphingosine 1-phosphate receptor 3 n=1 Tax=Bufo bufo TaxID=8384 RepID=UPI001ABE0C25|nr:sphingosine 1-phosphate receptor 3 [Bufo bufo]
MTALKVAISLPISTTMGADYLTSTNLIVQEHQKCDITIKLHYNYTGRPLKINGDRMDKTSLLFLIICSFIVLENLMVLIAIWKNNRFHNRMYFFIGNLALCDSLAGIAYIGNILMSGVNTCNISLTAWFVREGSMFIALGASTLSLLAIAIERHLTMIKMRPYDANKKYRVFLLIGTCWLISFSLGALPILGWNCRNNLEDCSTVLPLYSKKYVGFCISIFIAILIAIVILYARIYVLVKSSSRRVTNHSNSERSMALLRTVVIVVGVFIACWSPLFILLLIDVACKAGECQILYKTQWFIALAVLNSALNPLIYTLASKEMRRAFFRLVCACLAKSSTSRSLPIQPTPDQSRSKSSSSSNSPKHKGFLQSQFQSKEDKSESSFQNGNIIK